MTDATLSHVCATLQQCLEHLRVFHNQDLRDRCGESLRLLAEQEEAGLVWVPRDPNLKTGEKA